MVPVLIVAPREPPRNAEPRAAAVAILDHDADDFETEHDIYLEDAVLEYPQSGERIRGRRHIQITRAKQPSKKRFAVRRITGNGDLWITEYILTYDGKRHDSNSTHDPHFRYPDLVRHIY